jgi:hypothetical protein
VRGLGIGDLVKVLRKIGLRTFDWDNMGDRGFESLDFYQDSLRLLKAAYRLADSLPDHERYNLREIFPLPSPQSPIPNLHPKIQLRVNRQLDLAS